MSLSDYLAALNLSTYSPSLAAKGFTNVEDLTSLPELDLDSLFASVNMLKGHILKLRKSLDDSRRCEPSLVKKPRLDDSCQSFASKPTSPSPVKPPKSNSSGNLTKDVERLMAKLADIQETREDLERAKALVLGIDLERYRKALDQVEFIQKTMGAMEEWEGADDV